MDSGGYHETITRASIRAARDFLTRNPGHGLFHSWNALMASEFPVRLARALRDHGFNERVLRGGLNDSLQPKSG